MYLVICVILLLNSAPIYGNQILLETKSNYRSFIPSHFTLPIYKATMINGNENKVVFMDGPIIIENARDGMYFVITSDNYLDFELNIVEGNSTNSRQIDLNIINSKPMNKEFDVINIEALDEDYVPVSRTTVLLFNSNMELNIYKMTFKVDNEEYIILNFYYFKWFLGILTVTGLMILIIELHEIVRHLRISRDNTKYRELQVMTGYYKI